MPAAFTPYDQYREYPIDEMRARAQSFLDDMARRRTVREFSDRAVPRDVIERCLRTACTAPSGANQQPWHFVAVQDLALKRQIREAAEAEERAFYTERAPREWLEALAPLGTDAEKPFLEVAPWLIAVFAQPYGSERPGPARGSARETTPRKVKHYYVPESVGIATGFLIAALHQAGLATLTHTPSPMGFLTQILDRPSHERPFLLLVTGFPARQARVPAISKKPERQVFSVV